MQKPAPQMRSRLFVLSRVANGRGRIERIRLVLLQRHGFRRNSVSSSKVEAQKNQRAGGKDCRGVFPPRHARRDVPDLGCAAHAKMIGDAYWGSASSIYEAPLIPRAIISKANAPIKKWLPQ